MNDVLGDRMKEYENSTCGIKLMQKIPVIARLDGKAFSKFTKGLARPYDERLTKLMVETTKYLVKETNANCGYHQSDEITLVWYSDKIDSDMYFGGRLFKMISDLAAMASVFFNRHLPEYIAEKAHLMPRFDCRVFNVPTREEAANIFLWRELDATKNSISMAASHYYSHKVLENKNGSQKQEMLFQKGVNWNDYPAFFKRGTYIQRRKSSRKFTPNELVKLPAKHQARKNPDLMIERWSLVELDIAPIITIKNRAEVILYGAEPNTPRKFGYTLEDLVSAYNSEEESLEDWFNQTFTN